ncbi:MAG TPA: response regulator [Gammaproteobacteria bacterium]
MVETHERSSAARPRLLFVDDEQRVLNSMRIMFRREFDLFLASHGAQALDIVKDQDIDVIVADHRMPQMTGVEVLTKVRKLSPRTVRILLTGYADLDAVEGSINDGEVFRFLTKPCPPKQLRDTVVLAAKLARSAPAVPPPSDSELGDAEALEIILEGDRVSEAPASRARATETPEGTREFTSTTVLPNAMRIAATSQPAAEEPRAEAAPPKALANGLGVLVFSSDEEMIETVQRAVRARVPVFRATNVVQVVKILTEQRPGVLITDISSEKQTIQSMTARLKQHLPELVTIVVSPHRDVLDMVWLINHGQIFRFLRKPLSPGRCAVSLQAALQHHRMLLANPGLVRRHEVEEVNDGGGVMDSVISKLRSVRRLWGHA